MKKQDFYYDSKDGKTKLHAVRWTPEGGKVTVVLQIVHGMAEYIERYEPFARFLTDRGIAVTGEDHLGHGQSVPEGGTYGYFCEGDPASVVVEDVHSLRELTEKVYPGIPYFLLGHSMGSFIARNYMYRYAKGLAGVVVMGTGQQPQWLLKFSRKLAAFLGKLQGERHVSMLLQAAAFGSYNKRIKPARTKVDWLTKDEAIVDRYEADPLCGFFFTVNGFGTLFSLIAGAREEGAAERLPKELPVFVVSGEEDPVGAYGKGVREAYAQLEAAGLTRLTIKLYEGDRHEILNETDAGAVMEDIYGWMKNHMPEED